MGPFTGKIYIIYLILCTGIITCQIHSGLYAVDVEEQNINVIPRIEHFGSNLSSIEELENIIKEKCIENGAGEEAFKNPVTELAVCLNATLNMTQIKLDIEESNGSIEKVVGKYCKKYPEIRRCFENAVDKLKSCLDSAEQENLQEILKMVDKIKEYLCFKDGEHIIMFILGDGLQCTSSKREELQKCLNETVDSLTSIATSMNTSVLFAFSDEDCKLADKLATCVTAELKTCKYTTPANIFEDYFKFIIKDTPCEGNNLSSRTIMSFFILVISVIISKFC